MKTIRCIRPLCCDTYEGKPYEVNLTSPEYLLPATNPIFGEGLRVFTDISGANAVTAQLCSYGDAWRFWVDVVTL